jgi:hypothetical protein
MEQVGIGTRLKINVHIEPMGDLHMSDYNFAARFYTRALKPVVVNKEDMIKIDSDNYIALVDTRTMTAGLLQMVIHAEIPDGDFADGLRYEVSAPINTGIPIVK